MDDSDELIKNLDKLHSTPMGYERIKKNIGLSGDDLEIIFQCKKMILNRQSKIERNGKNWYVQFDDVKLTVNAFSFTIITAHKIK